MGGEYIWEMNFWAEHFVLKLLLISVDLLFNFFKSFFVDLEKFNLKKVLIFFLEFYASKCLLRIFNRIILWFLFDFIDNCPVEWVLHFFREILVEVNVVHLDEIFIDSNEFVDEIRLFWEVLVEWRAVPDSNEEENSDHEEISCRVNNHEWVHVHRSLINN